MLKMKNYALILFLMVLTLFTSCSKDDSNDPDDGPLEKSTYTLNEVNGSGVIGTVIISENKDGSSTVGIKLDGSTTDLHPAFIYHGNVSQDTEMAITLNACTCETSTTTVTELDNGTKISYDGLKAFNGNVRIHQSASNETIVASGNIGVNGN
jgi:hypothetical protein